MSLLSRLSLTKCIIIHILDKIPRRIYDRLSPQLQRECEVENYYNRMAAANRE